MIRILPTTQHVTTSNKTNLDEVSETLIDILGEKLIYYRLRGIKLTKTLKKFYLK